MGLTMTKDGARPMCDLCKEPLSTTDRLWYTALKPALLFAHERCLTPQIEALAFGKARPHVRTVQQVIEDLGEWLM
jgi:hypothetical protein